MYVRKIKKHYIRNINEESLEKGINLINLHRILLRERRRIQLTEINKFQLKKAREKNKVGGNKLAKYT